VSGSRRPVVKIFIVAGDDNVEGFASLAHLQQLHRERPSEYEHLFDASAPSSSSSSSQQLPAKLKVRGDVLVSYEHYRKDAANAYANSAALLRDHLGAANFAGDAASFGPELQLGHVLGDAYSEPVVLVKAGWKGRTLKKDFVPPPSTLSDGSGNRNAAAGYQWLRMMASVHKTANELGSVLGPAYRHCAPQVAGLIWWHGYSDVLAMAGPNGNSNNGGADPAAMLAEYEADLVAFINEVRRQLKSPGLPVVIAELGGLGPNTTDATELAFRALQRRVANETALDGAGDGLWNVRYVETARHVKSAPAIKDYTLYGGNAATMIEIGNALAAAVLDLDPYKVQHYWNGGASAWFFRDYDLQSRQIGTWQERQDVLRYLLPAAAGVFVFVAIMRYGGSMHHTWDSAAVALQFRVANDGDDNGNVDHHHSTSDAAAVNMECGDDEDDDEDDDCLGTGGAKQNGKKTSWRAIS
jgi:Carbohydrate esterase, sialic acid-specific acetylesterase